MNFNKKHWITFGSIVAVAAPIASVISCGVNEPQPEDVKTFQDLKSDRVASKIVNLWLEKAISKWDTAFDPHDALKNDFLKTADFYFASRLIKDPTYLSNLSTTIYTMKAFDTIAPTIQDKTTKINLWGMKNLHVENGKWLASQTNRLEAMKFILENFLNIKQDIYKLYLGSLYLANATLEQLQTKIWKDDKRLTQTQELIDKSNFVLIDKMISERLFATWQIDLDETKSLKFIDKTPIADTQAVRNSFKPGGELYSLAKHGLKIKSANSTLIDTKIDDEDLIGYTGIKSFKQSSLRQDEGILSFTINEYKKATDESKWEGVTRDGKFLNQDIPYMEETGKIVTVPLVRGLMPIYINDHLSLGPTFNTDSLLLRLNLANEEMEDVFKEALDYLTAEKLDDADKVLINIKNDILFKFLKDEKQLTFVTNK